MSTRSYIGIKEGSGFKTVYCHGDGYLSGVGYGLVRNYNTIEKVKKLMKKGDMSFLASDPKDILYYKDNGESDVDARVRSMETIKKDVSFDIEFVYIFNNGVWYVMNDSTDFELIKVEDTAEYKEHAKKVKQQEEKEKEKRVKDEKDKIVKFNALMTKMIGNYTNVQLFTSKQDKRNHEFNKYAKQFKDELEGENIRQLGQFQINDKLGVAYGETYKGNVYLVLISRTISDENLTVEIIRKQNYVEVIELNSKKMNTRKLKRFPNGTKDIVAKLLNQKG